MNPKQAVEKQESTFEDALERLETIVRRLDDGKTDLETALSDYEEGVALLRHCHALLQNAQRRIEVLRGVDAEGRLCCEPLAEETFLTEEPTVRERENKRGAS